MEGERKKKKEKPVTLIPPRGVKGRCRCRAQGNTAIEGALGEADIPASREKKKRGEATSPEGGAIRYWFKEKTRKERDLHHLGRTTVGKKNRPDAPKKIQRNLHRSEEGKKRITFEGPPWKIKEDQKKGKNPICRTSEEE